MYTYICEHTGTLCCLVCVRVMCVCTPYTRTSEIVNTTRTCRWYVVVADLCTYMDLTFTSHIYISH